MVALEFSEASPKKSAFCTSSGLQSFKHPSDFHAKGWILIHGEHLWDWWREPFACFVTCAMHFLHEKKKSKPTFLFLFACLYSIPFFLDFIFVSCTPIAVSFPIYNCPHNSIRHLPAVPWDMIGIYTYFFLMLPLLSCRVSWAEAAKVEMGLFYDTEFLFTLQRRQSKKVPCNWSRWCWPWLFPPERLI